MTSLTDRLLGGTVAALLRALARTDPDHASALCGAVARRIGPRLPAHRVGRANLRHAFPDRSEAWIEETLAGVWENLGRVAGEYVHLGTIARYDPDHPEANRIETDDLPLFLQMRDDDKPALCFAAHLANWELPAAAMAAHIGSAAVYRMPNNRIVAAEIERIRAPIMGELIPARADAPLRMAAVLQRGDHLGVLVDQHFSRGVDVTFFGRRCKANPTIARLAARFDCPVVGVRVIRRAGVRFRMEGVGPIDLPRDARGNVDVAATMQRITTIVEGWVREYPDQWLWLHRRWR
ncbi:MAG TPA: lipid A biosynthesis lauroyl acyltransferase [Acetobacteraceae bacterium]|nr:lipid A biosynthesis lauroyl acyltransferase [Acetobacteraceae bacterium]